MQLPVMLLITTDVGFRNTSETRSTEDTGQTESNASRSRGYIKIFMLSSAKHEILNAHMDKNIIFMHR